MARDGCNWYSELPEGATVELRAHNEPSGADPNDDL